MQAAIPELELFDKSTTESLVEDSASALESSVDDSTTPSAIPNLPKASDFYKTWENYFLTEVLQAIANILNEDKPDLIISEQKKNESYKLLHSLMTVMLFDDLCEGLALTEEKQAILLQKLLIKSQANYSPEMAQFAARKAMNIAHEKWINGKPFKNRQKICKEDFKIVKITYSSAKFFLLPKIISKIEYRILQKIYHFQIFL